METIDRVLVTYLANALWIACLVAAGAALGARAIRSSPSSHRHLLWVLALVLASLLPLASVQGGSGLPRPVAISGPLDTGPSLVAGEEVRASSPSSFWQDVRRRKSKVSFAPLLAEALAGAYICLIALRAHSLYRAWRRTAVILRGASPLPRDREAGIVEALASTLAAGRVTLASSADVEGPVVLGVWRRVLVLPQWFVEKSSEDELASTLWHELAHVRRHDFALNLVYELLLLPIAFHPAALFIKRQVERSRELACDEFAARKLPTPTVYARSLLSIAQSIQRTTSLSSSSCAVGMFEKNTLEERIVSLLKKDGPSDRWMFARFLAASCLLAALAFGSSVFSVQIVNAGAGPTLDEFAGVWEAQLHGKTFLTLKLSTSDGRLFGTVSRSRIEMGPGGELTSAEAVEGFDPILPVAPEGKLLHLVVPEKGHVEGQVNGTRHDSDEAVEFDMTLVAPGAGELRVAAPAGMPAPAPWRLERKAVKAASCTDGAPSGSAVSKPGDRTDGRARLEALPAS